MGIFRNLSLRRNTSPAAASNKPKSKESSVSWCGEKRLLKESQLQDKLIKYSRHTSSHWEANLIGPEKCPFENGTVFAVSIHIPTKYPFKPPKIVLINTKIFHPNINEHGEISICSVLSNPAEPFVPGNPAVKLYQHDPNAYEKTAKMWTLEYANA
ncbi:hypothetical protein N665_3000s0005 [Sinapis alba]|nr:hypothetical protein N665_3000s0005 [Sinapis alba]